MPFTIPKIIPNIKIPILTIMQVIGTIKTYYKFGVIICSWDMLGYPPKTKILKGS